MVGCGDEVKNSIKYKKAFLTVRIYNEKNYCHIS
jgi:hypothetical protein